MNETTYQILVIKTKPHKLICVSLEPNRRETIALVDPLLLLSFVDIH